MFYDNFVKACNSRNKAPSAVAIDIGISKATVTGWKNGSTPNDTTLQKLADYFGISPEDLMNASRQTEGNLAQKLEELSLILESYNSICARGKKDPRDQMTWLLEQLEDSNFAEDHVF